VTSRNQGISLPITSKAVEGELGNEVAPDRAVIEATGTAIKTPESDILIAQLTELLSRRQDRPQNSKSLNELSYIFST